MSRMVDGDFWQPPVDKRAVADAQFARAGISRPADLPPEPPVPTKSAAERTRKYLAWLAERDGFITTPAGVVLSPVLAKMLHYRETPPAPAAGPAIDDSDAEARSLDEAMR